MALDRDPNHVFRDFVTDRVPSSGNWNPRKPEIRQLLTEWWQTLIALVADAGGLDLPNLLISMTVTGGDENAIVADANLPVPSGPGLAVFSIVIEEANTGPVTINGKPLLSNTGNELVAGALAADGIYLFLDNGDSYRLLSDYVSSSIIAAAEAAAGQAASSAGAALGFAERAEAAATSVESPVSYAPQSLTDEQQEQARDNIGAVSADDQRLRLSKARIRHFRTGGLIYDAITVSAPKLQTVRKEFAPGVAPDGVVTRVPARQMSAANGYSIVINADGWRNADGTPGSDKPQGRPMGLQIANGTLYQDWTPEEHRTQAIVMMSDGKLVEANKGDGISGAQWVANGAQWSISWGMVCVRNGVPVDLTGGYVADVVSARTVIGQKPNGDIVVVMVEGISESYGATPTQCGPLMASLGCEIAYICDGGGSTQGWWENTYAVPSSDRTDVHYPMERGVVSFIVIEPDMPVQQYDSGFISVGPLNEGFTAMGGGNLPGNAPAVAVRHLGAEIKMMLRVQGTFPANADANVAPDGTIPSRYLYSINGPTRVFGAANGYVPAVVGIPPAGSIVVKVADTSARTQAIGYGGWPAMFSGLPTKPGAP